MHLFLSNVKRSWFFLVVWVFFPYHLRYARVYSVPLQDTSHVYVVISHRKTVLEQDEEDHCTYQLPSCQTSHSPPGVTLLAVLHRHCHGHCCARLTDSPPPSVTKLATDSHADFVHLCNARVDECINSFICSIDELWNGPWSSLASFCAADPFSTGVSDHYLGLD